MATETLPHVAKLTAADHGRRMTLEEFENSETGEGLRVELSHGIVDVHHYETNGSEMSNVPSIGHGMIEDRIEEILAGYRLGHRGVIRYMGPGSRAKLVLPVSDSERNPDFSIYFTDPPPGDQPWRDWMPQIVVEIVSESSRRRDYVDKMDDYWHAGIDEYWIIDPQDQQIQLCRRGEKSWAITVLRGDQSLTTKLLPDFALEPAAIFAIK